MASQTRALLSEADVLKFWKSIDAFQESLRVSKDGKRFVFFDGPPFATGLPHYGHLVASTIKDIIPRYKTQTGYYVDRKWGTDCHGLPIEFEIEKMLGIKTKAEILEYGIAEYNNKCRGIVMKYSGEWRETIDRLGRWVDMDNDYKTMDRDYMESVWWVFSELYKKGLVYRGFKVIYYSMGCASPISNFEAKSNYKTTSDWAINVIFELENGERALVYTTTPWTLPANLALAVNPDFDYLKIKFTDDKDENVYIVGKIHLERTLKTIKPRKYTVVETVKGKKLVGLKFKPLFNYYSKYRPGKAFKIYGADFVVAEKGTGIVHCAPAHGEEDYGLCLKNKMFQKTDIPPCPLDDDCNFTDVVKHFSGQNVKAAEDSIVEHLKKNGQLFSKGKECHEYPFCWRSDTPLIQRVCECWFIDVKSITKELVENNEKVVWVPEVVGKNRFGEWLKNSVDWCVSRNRFWGTPLPLWSNKDGSTVVCVNSVSQLEQYSQRPSGSITDIHRDSIDNITIPDPAGGHPLARVEYVFDCWFESGSMPYAQNHFPFKKDFEYQPADFIAEGLDQTRGWFYTLLVIGTALFGESPYKNVIVNGIVLAEDGEKMSKRKQNYPPVTEILDEFGADALRLYLINTPVVKAGDIKFQKDDIREVARRYNMMLKNAVKFYFEMIDLYLDKNPGKKKKGYRIKSLKVLKAAEANLTVTDQWILQCLDELIKSVHQLMNTYHLNGIVEKFFKFIDQLSRWYMNLNKKRYKRCESPFPLDVLGNCLYYFSLLSAPFAPFISESVYQELRTVGCLGNDMASIHFHQIPQSVWNSKGDLLELFEYVSDIVDATRAIRARRDNPSVKLPLLEIVLTHSSQSVLDTLKLVEEYLKDQLNIECVRYSTDIDSLVEYDLHVDVQQLKKRVEGKQIGQVMKYVKTLSATDKQKIGSTSQVPEDSPVQFNELKVVKSARDGVNVVTTNRLSVQYDDTVTPELLEKFCANQFHRAYQDARKKAGLVQTDKIVFSYSCTPELNAILVKHGVVEANEGVYVPDTYLDDTPGSVFYIKSTLELGDVMIYIK